MKLKYAFNLGRVFTLSLAELVVKKLQRRLGGTIKIMKVLDSLGRKKIAGPSWVFKDYFDAKVLKEKFLNSTSGKIQIGISLYPLARELPLRGEIKRLGLGI